MQRCVTSFCTRTSCSIRKRGLTITSDRDERSGGGLIWLAKRYFASHWPYFLGGTLFAILTSLAATSYGLLVKYVGDGLQFAVNQDPEIASAGGLQQLLPFDENNLTGWIWWAAAGIVIAATVRALSLYAMTLLNNTGVQRALVDVQNNQYAALIDGEFSRLAGSASGGFVSRFINDVNALRDAGLRLANNLTKGIATVVGGFAGMIYMDWQLTMILLVAYPLAFGPVIALGNRIRTRAKRAQSQVGEVTALLSEGFQSARIVKAYQLEAYQKDRAKFGFSERARLFLKVLRDRAAVDPILEVAGGVALAGVFGFSAWRIISGEASLGDLLGFIALIGIIAPEIRALGTLNAVAQEGGAAADRVREIVLDRSEAARTTSTSSLATVDGAIAFEGVSFGYTSDAPVLRDLSLSARQGETIALVGASGSGKSTVFNLLLRLYDPSAGRVLIDGVDIQSLSIAELRAQIALVSQDAVLFDDTIAANIRLGRPDATDEDIIEAAKAANAHTFIEAFADGYATGVGEAGRNLSGGQRQRIAIARALLKDAPILLLDEATSALDSESEAQVQAAIDRLSVGRTSILIAHRLSTIRNADRIFVLDAGQVIESGTHDELVKKGGTYQKLQSLQPS